MKRAFLGIACTGLLSVGLYSCLESNEATVAGEGKVRVEIMSVQPVAVSGSRVYSGTVEQSTESMLSFSVGGTVKTVNVSAGDRVDKGQLIASLDDATLRNSYDIAKAALDQAQDVYDRMKQLHEANSLSDMKWVEVENTLKSAQSAEAIARKALADGNIYAPFSGYVTEKFVDAGMTVAPTVPVVKIVTINPAKVSVSVQEGEIGSISPGQKAVVTLKALGDRQFEGYLTEKGVSANLLSRSYDVKFTVDNPTGELLPGMICDVVMLTDGSRTAMVLPTGAVLLAADNTNFVWLDIDGKAYRRQVTVDGMADNGVVISAGIVAGDSVIVAGQQKVSEGTPLTVINR